MNEFFCVINLGIGSKNFFLATILKHLICVITTNVFSEKSPEKAAEKNLKH